MEIFQEVAESQKKEENKDASATAGLLEKLSVEDNKTEVEDKEKAKAKTEEAPTACKEKVSESAEKDEGPLPSTWRMSLYSLTNRSVAPTWLPPTSCYSDFGVVNGNASYMCMLGQTSSPISGHKFNFWLKTVLWVDITSCLWSYAYGSILDQDILEGLLECYYVFFPSGVTEEVNLMLFHVFNCVWDWCDLEISLIFLLKYSQLESCSSPPQLS